MRLSLSEAATARLKGYWLAVRGIVTVLLLVAFVMLGVGLSFALARGGDSLAGLRLGVGAAVGVVEESGHYTVAELEALARPLPAGAAQVQVPVLMYHYVDDEPPPKSYSSAFSGYSSANRTDPFTPMKSPSWACPGAAHYSASLSE